MAGLGMTETAPSCLFTTGPVSGAGYIGLPAPGCQTKIAPVDGKPEVCFRGPNVMSGYWRASAAQSQDVFDDEGYHRSGDAVRLSIPGGPRLALSSMVDRRRLHARIGHLVSVGPMRARIVSEGAPYVQDAVITGMNRDDVGAMVLRSARSVPVGLLGLGRDARAADVRDPDIISRGYLK